MDWYWALSGFTWVMVTVLMGGALLGGIGLIVIGAAKSIANSFEHDPQTCTCYSCERRRAKTLNRQARTGKRQNPIIIPGGLVSTNQLELGMVVVAQKSGITYQFEGKVLRAYGCSVVFKNLNTGKSAWIVVPLARLDVPMWKIADIGLRRVYGL